MVVRKSFSRTQLLAYTTNLPSALIEMEAAEGPDFLRRELREHGYEVRLIPARFVQLFVKFNKNDCRNTEALEEAVERENMGFMDLSAEPFDSYRIQCEAILCLQVQLAHIPSNRG